MPEREPQNFSLLQKNFSRRDLLRGTATLVGAAILFEACKDGQEIPEFSNQPFNHYPQLSWDYTPPNRFFWKDLSISDNLFNDRFLTITWSDGSVTEYSLDTGEETELIAASHRNSEGQVGMVSADRYYAEGVIWEDQKHIVKDNGDEFTLYDAITKRPIGKLKPSEFIFRSKEDRKESPASILATDEKHVFFALHTPVKMPLFILERENNLLRIEDLEKVGKIEQMAIVGNILFIKTFRLDSFRIGAGPNQPDIGYVGLNRIFAYRITD